MKISDLEGQLITSKPVGGMPETAKEQLEKFMVGLLCFYVRGLLVCGVLFGALKHVR